MKTREILLIQSWWVEQIFLGAARYAKSVGWRLDSRMRWTGRLPSAKNWSGDGIIAFVGESEPHLPCLEFIKDAKVPVVDLGCYGNFLNAPRVSIDDFKIGCSAADHFRSIGLREFCFVEIPPNPSQTQRKHGFQYQLAQMGFKSHVIYLKDLETELPKLPRPMGIFSTHDLVSDEIIDITLRMGFHVPEEFAVLGCNDTEILCDWSKVPLSSVNCNQEECGFQAAVLLDRLIQGEVPPARPTIIAPKGVTARRSTDIIAIPDLPTARALGYIRKNFATAISVPEIARFVGVSTRTLQTSFSKYVGRTMIEEITRLKIEHAKLLLRDPAMKIRTVADNLGFQSRSHFMRLFKLHTGLTPNEARNLYLDIPKQSF
jgi:LacI family transcriptional regulator